jgi:hypothetical protein
MQRLESSLFKVTDKEAKGAVGRIIIDKGEKKIMVRGSVKIGYQLVYYPRPKSPKVKLCFEVLGITNDDFVIPHPSRFKFESETDSPIALEVQEKLYNAIIHGKYIINVRNCRLAVESLNETIK